VATAVGHRGGPGEGGAALDAGGRQAVGKARGADMRRRGEGEAGGGRWAVAAR
jgi:hypothetical protein